MIDKQETKSPINVVNCKKVTVDFDCIVTKLDKTLAYPICVYTKDDYISGILLNNGTFEQENIKHVLELLREDGDLQLVDIGANFGLYTLAAAHSKSKVIAVEANYDNMRRLGRGVCLGNVKEYVTLAYNAVYNKHTQLLMGVENTNRAASRLMEKNSRCTNFNNHKELYCDDKHAVQTITMDDLVPLISTKKAIVKIDIEAGELNAFDPKTSTEFFRRIEVPVIFMEWYWVRHHNKKTPEVLDKFLNLFYQLNYTIFGKYHEKVERDWNKWPFDIVLRKI